MRTLAAAGVIAVVAAGLGFGFPVSAHEGGHQGGCEDFGQVNGQIAREGHPAFPWADSLGDIVSYFAHLDDAHPGVTDIVENVDHLACDS
jgi:hypothetical protein